MKKKEIFATYAAALGQHHVLLYCFDQAKVTINEFISLEAYAQYQAVKKEYHIFKVYNTYLIGFTAIGLN